VLKVERVYIQIVHTYKWNILGDSYNLMKNISITVRGSTLVSSVNMYVHCIKRYYISISEVSELHIHVTLSI